MILWRTIGLAYSYCIPMRRILRQMKIGIVQSTSYLTDQLQSPRLPVNEDQLAAYLSLLRWLSAGQLRISRVLYVAPSRQRYVALCRCCALAFLR